MPDSRRSTQDSSYTREREVIYEDDYPPNRWDRERFDNYTMQRQSDQDRRPSDRRIIIEERTRQNPSTGYRAWQEVPRDDMQLISRKQSGDDREIIIDIDRRREGEGRPGMQRRQSSLDTFDRKPVRRVEEEFIFASPRQRDGHRRSASSATQQRRENRPTYVEKETDEVVRYVQDEPSRQGGREVVYEKEIKTETRRRRRTKSGSRSRSRQQEAYESSSSSSSSSAATLIGKKGFTRLPMNKFTKSAVKRLQIDFSEEDGFWRVERALGKEDIDRVLQWSQEKRTETKKTTYLVNTPGVGGGGGGGNGVGKAEKDEFSEEIRTEWYNPNAFPGYMPAPAAAAAPAPAPAPAPDPPQWGLRPVASAVANLKAQIPLILEQRGASTNYVYEQPVAPSPGVGTTGAMVVRQPFPFMAAPYPQPVTPVPVPMPVQMMPGMMPGMMPSMFPPGYQGGGFEPGRNVIRMERGPREEKEEKKKKKPDPRIVAAAMAVLS